MMKVESLFKTFYANHRFGELRYFWLNLPR
jgi:hypothetical protein